MALRFAYTQPNGMVAIVIAAPKEALAPLIGVPGALGIRTLSDDAYRQHVLARSIPADATNLHELAADWTPPDDRTYRNAWVTDGKTVSVDMVKAKVIQQDRIREMRHPLFTKLDIAQKKAMVQKDDVTVQAIEVQLQALRDAPADPSIQAATTPEELKAAVPAAVLPK